MKPHYPFIASKNYKGGTTSGCEVQLSNASSYQQPELIPDPWYVPDNLTSGAKDLGSV